DLDRDPDPLSLLDHEVAIPRAPAVVYEPVLGAERAEIEPAHTRQHVAHEQLLERAVLQQVPVAREPNRYVHCVPLNTLPGRIIANHRATDTGGALGPVYSINSFDSDAGARLRQHHARSQDGHRLALDSSRYLQPQVD